MAEEEVEQQPDQSTVRAFWDATLSVPAVYSNNASVLEVPNGVRVTFGESLDGNSNFWVRSAITMGDVTAFTLWEALGRSEAVKRVQTFLESEQRDAAP